MSPSGYEMTLFDETGAVRPYAGSSGWSGSSTSKARADEADTSGATSARQGLVLGMLRDSGIWGLTVKELRESTGWHHGTASGALSVLHLAGHIFRLSESRDRCKVYVLGEFVVGRDVEAHGHKPKSCPNCGHVAEDS